MHKSSGCKNTGGLATYERAQAVPHFHTPNFEYSSYTLHTHTYTRNARKKKDLCAMSWQGSDTLRYRDAGCSALLFVFSFFIYLFILLLLA